MQEVPFHGSVYIGSMETKLGQSLVHGLFINFLVAIGRFHYILLHLYANSDVIFDNDGGNHQKSLSIFEFNLNWRHTFDVHSRKSKLRCLYIETTYLLRVTFWSLKWSMHTCDDLVSIRRYSNDGEHNQQLYKNSSY